MLKHTRVIRLLNVVTISTSIQQNFMNRILFGIEEIVAFSTESNRRHLHWIQSLLALAAGERRRTKNLT